MVMGISNLKFVLKGHVDLIFSKVEINLLKKRNPHMMWVTTEHVAHFLI